MNGVGHMHPGLPPVWQSDRPPMHECSEDVFLADLAAFLRVCFVALASCLYHLVRICPTLPIPAVGLCVQECDVTLLDLDVCRNSLPCISIPDASRWQRWPFFDFNHHVSATVAQIMRHVSDLPLPLQLWIPCRDCAFEDVSGMKGDGPAELPEDPDIMLVGSQERKHAKINSDNFPDAVLNGQRLDLHNLYREVSQRGGWKVGNGINWKGQVFPQMRNFSNSHRCVQSGLSVSVALC